MIDRFWKRQINRLERAGNDDFLLILTGGAKAYATHELHQLLRRLRIESLRLRRLRQIMLGVGIGIPGLLFAACAAGLLGLVQLVYALLVAFGVFTLILISFNWYVSGNFRCHDRGKRLRCIIQQELERRRKDAPHPRPRPKR